MKIYKMHISPVDGFWARNLGILGAVGGSSMGVGIVFIFPHINLAISIAIFTFLGAILGMVIGILLEKFFTRMEKELKKK